MVTNKLVFVVEFDITIGRGGACSSRLLQNNIFEHLIAFSRATNGRPYGFVRCRFVCGIYFFTGGASPSPTDLYVAALSAQGNEIYQTCRGRRPRRPEKMIGFWM